MDPELTRTLQLVHRAQDGDRQALDRLFRRYYDTVRRIVRMRLGRKLRSRVDSGDILHDTFLAALKAFDRFEVRDEASFVTWLARIAENQIGTAAAHHGAQKRDPAREVPLGTPTDSRRIGIDPVASGMLPSDAVAQDEQTVLVESCIAELPADLRELIILRDYAGASWASIAEDTGRPSADAARMKHATALVELAKRVKRATKPAG